MRGDDLAGMGAEVLEEMRPRAAAAVKDSALLLEGRVKQTLTGQRTGREYRVPNTQRTYIASRAGEPPAVMTGRLRADIGHEGPKWDGDTVTAEVGTNVEYAHRLEVGGRDARGVYIAPRPYMRPALEQARVAIEARLEQV